MWLTFDASFLILEGKLSQPNRSNLGKGLKQNKYFEVLTGVGGRGWLQGQWRNFTLFHDGLFYIIREFTYLGWLHKGNVSLMMVFEHFVESFQNRENQKYRTFFKGPYFCSNRSGTYFCMPNRFQVHIYIYIHSYLYSAMICTSMFFSMGII